MPPVPTLLPTLMSSVRYKRESKKGMSTVKWFTPFLTAITMVIIWAPLGLSTAEAESIGLSVRPAKLEIQAIPGTKETKEITLTNISNQELNIKVSVHDFEITIDNT